MMVRDLVWVDSQNVMYGIPRTAAVRTVATCELLVLEPQLFLELFADDMARTAAQAATCMKQCIHAFNTLPPRCAGEALWEIWGLAEVEGGCRTPVVQFPRASIAAPPDPSTL